MAIFLPNPVFATYQPHKAFGVGPIDTGIALKSGEYFSGRWAFWLASVDGGRQVRYKRVSGINDGVALTDDGIIYTGFSVNELSSASNSRFDLLSFAFTSSGIPLVAIQDKGDNFVGLKSPPEITISYSGNQKITFNGTNPNLFNFAQVNWPYSVPNSLYPTYNTGQLACYYYKGDSTGLYVRYISDGFSSESIAASGLQSGFLTSSRSECFPADLNQPYSPYSNTIITLDDNGNLVRVLSQKPYINFAFDDFNRNHLGNNIFILTGGYGLWKKRSNILFSSGKSFYADFFFYENFANYNTGSGQYNFNLNISLNNIYITGLTEGTSFYKDIYFYDDFIKYSTGEILFLEYNTLNYQSIIQTGVTTGITLN